MKALSFHDITQKSKWEIFEKASFQNSGLTVTQWSVNLVKENIKMKGLEDLGPVWLFDWTIRVMYLYFFEIFVGEKVCEKMCNVI